MNRLSKFAFIATALVAAPLTAFADDEPATVEAGGSATVGAGASTDGAMPTPAAGDMAPATPPMPGLTLAKGKAVIAGETVNIGLFPDPPGAGKPISLAPSVWYGVSDKLTVGVTHDGGTTGWTPRPSINFGSTTIAGVTVPSLAGPGICVTGTDGGCPKVYNNASVDALFALSTDKLSLAVHPALDIASFDPLFLRIRAGVLGRYMASSKVAITFDPRIGIGLTKRDNGNKENIDLPVWFWYHLNDKVGLAINSGISGPLSKFGDSFFIPVGFNFTYMVNDKMEVGADFSFLNLIGKNSTADAKMLGLRFAYHL